MKKGKFQRGSGAYDFDYVDQNHLMGPNFDWKSVSTVELMKIKNSSAGREYPGLKELLKKELSTRPHIPNAIESKEVRKRKAHNQKHKSK